MSHEKPPNVRLTFSESARLVEAGSRYVAGGVNSSFRAGMGGGPLVFERGEGPYLFDADGNRLIDYYGGMGAAVLGHDPAGVREAVRAQVGKGILFAGQSRLEYEAARLICECVPSAERVRFCSSGSEAAQAALRLARAATGRAKIIKFEGHYHGWFDNILWSTAPVLNEAGPRAAPVAVGGSAGQASGAEAHLVILPWNDAGALASRLAEGDVAAVLMEPAMCNQGAIAPAPGYLESARAACRDHGALLIFDEVITGFRLGRGGAQARFGVTPDLTILAKALASGFPVAAVAGRAELMDLFARGGVVQGGTFNAQPVCMAAAIATLNALTDAYYEASFTEGLRLRAGVAAALAEAGVQAQVTGFELVFHVAFGLDAPAHDWRDLARADRAAYARFAHALLTRGVRALERGAWFVSAAHRGEVIDRTLDIVREAAREIAAG